MSAARFDGAVVRSIEEAPENRRPRIPSFDIVA
jgi:hypothetical protein